MKVKRGDYVQYGDRGTLYGIERITRDGYAIGVHRRYCGRVRAMFIDFVILDAKTSKVLEMAQGYKNLESQLGILRREINKEVKA